MNVVESVIRQLRLRGQGAAVRKFARERQLSARSNDQLALVLQKNFESGKITEDELTKFFHELTLFSGKRVFVLNSQVAFNNGATIAQLGITATAPVSLIPHIGPKAKRPSTPGIENPPGYHTVLPGNTGVKSAHVFVTSRPVIEEEELNENDIDESVRSKHQGKRFTAPRAVNLQCFDVVIETAGKTLLLVDAPRGIDQFSLRQDIEKYRHRLSATDSPFQDLWAAVGGIYSTPTEGAINFVRFMSNERSNQVGTLGRTSNSDYRKLPYHVAGSTIGLVDVYAIGVCWNGRHGRAYASLPGTARMLERAPAANGIGFIPALEYFDTPQPMLRENFEHAAQRILAHV